MRRLAPLLLLLCLAGPIGAESFPTPPPVSDGPLVKVTPSRAGTLRPGQLLVLTVTGDAETVACRLVGGGSDSYHVSDNGRTVSFAAERGGTYTLIFAGAKRTDSAAPALSLVEHTITVEGAAPQPGPGPTPKPDDPKPVPPGPVIPPDRDRYGLATEAYTRAVNLRQKAPGARLAELADNFGAVAEGIARGEIGTVAEMHAALRDRNRATAGVDATRYGETLIAPVATKWAALKLTGMADNEAALREVAYGIRAAAK